MPSERLLAFLTWRTDDNHPRSIVSLSLLISLVGYMFFFFFFRDFVPIYIFKKCQTILWVKVSNYNTFCIKTFTNLMMINDCILFSTIPNFHFLALQLHRAHDLLLGVGQRRCLCWGPMGSLCLWWGERGWRGDLGRQQACFFSVQTSSRQAINRGDREKQWQSLWFWFTPMLKNPNKLEEQNNTQQEINHIND